jgi:hypothetical protein
MSASPEIIDLWSNLAAFRDSSPYQGDLYREWTTWQGLPPDPSDLTRSLFELVEDLSSLETRLNSRPIDDEFYKQLSDFYCRLSAVGTNQDLPQDFIICLQCLKRILSFRSSARVTLKTLRLLQPQLQFLFRGFSSRVSRQASPTPSPTPSQRPSPQTRAPESKSAIKRPPDIKGAKAPPQIAARKPSVPIGPAKPFVPVVDPHHEHMAQLNAFLIDQQNGIMIPAQTDELKRLVETARGGADNATRQKLEEYSAFLKGRAMVPLQFLVMMESSLVP